MERDSEWLRVVYGEAARKIAERERERAAAGDDQRQSARKSAYPGSSRPADADAGAARPL